MKTLKDFRPQLVEEEKSDYSKFDVLVRAGLANKAQMQRIHSILDRMQEEKPTFNNADRAIIQNLFNRMVDLISNNKQIYMQARRSIKEEVDELDEARSSDSPNDPPYVLVLRRKAIRLYPDGGRVALYYTPQIDKYFSVPYSFGADTVVQAEEVESIDEISSDLLSRYKEKAKKSADALNAQGKYKQANDRTLNVMRATGKQIEKTTASIRKHLNKEETQIEEAVMDQLHKIVAGKQAQSVKFASGHTRKVDHFTASAITQVHKSLNDENKKKFADMVHKSPAHLMKAADFAFKHAK
jgi:hypothetical protein